MVFSSAKMLNFVDDTEVICKFDVKGCNGNIHQCQFNMPYITMLKRI